MRLENGQQAITPREALVGRRSGGYFLPASLAEFLAAPASDTALPATGSELAAGSGSGAAVVVPIVVKALQVGRRAVAAGGGRIHKTMREHVETVGDADAVRVSVDEPRITWEQEGRVANVRFRKQYEIGSRGRTERGAVVQQLCLSPGDCQWQIFSERDLRVIR